MIKFTFFFRAGTAFVVVFISDKFTALFTIDIFVILPIWFIVQFMQGIKSAVLVPLLVKPFFCVFTEISTIARFRSNFDAFCPILLNKKVKDFICEQIIVCFDTFGI